MRVSAVYACVRLIANTIGQLGLVLYRRTADGRERADDHPLFRILHSAPNSEATAYGYWSCVGQHLALRGNHYSLIERTAGSTVTALWPLNPDHVITKVDGGERTYRVYDTASHEWRWIDPGKILHIADITEDGVSGISPIACAAGAVGHYIAARDHGAAFLRNGAKFSGIIERPAGVAWSPEARTQFKESWQKNYTGFMQSGKTPILEDGMKLTSIGIAPDDAQLLETLQFGIADIARIFGVPPHLIGSLERATFDNITEQDREFVKFHMQPRLAAIAQRVQASLLSGAERDLYYCEHVLETLLRGDIEARYKAYAQGRQWGWLSANDIRRRENDSPIDGGDVYLEPENMRPSGTYVPRQGSGPNQQPAPTEE